MTERTAARPAGEPGDPTGDPTGVGSDVPGDGGTALAVDPSPEHPVLARLRGEGALGAQVRRGVASAAVTRVVMAVVTFGGQIVLMSLLLPADFGLVALGLVVTGFATLLSGLGLTAAVVQTRRVTDRLLTTAFWLSAGVGLTTTAVVAALAPLVARAYGEPMVGPLLQVSALAFALNLSIVPTALLERSLRFGTIGTVDVAASLAGLGTSIALAVAGLGPYALVIGPLAQVVVLTLSTFAITRWLPRGLPGRAELGQLWRFGRGVTGANLLYFTSRNVDTVLLGLTVPTAALGLYSRAYNIMMLPLTQVTHVLTRVLLPAYSQMQDDLPRLRRAWLTTVRASLLLGLPVGLGVAATAPAFVEAAYPPRWLPMVPVLVLLASSLPPQLVARNFGSVYQSLGRTGLQFRVAVLGTVVTVVGVLAGLPWGITGVATALLVTSFARFGIGLRPLLRMLGMRPSELWRAVRGLLLAGAVLAGAAVGAGFLAADLPALAVLGVQVVAGALGYLAALALVERSLVVAGLRRLRRSRRG